MLTDQHSGKLTIKLNNFFLQFLCLYFADSDAMTKSVWCQSGYFFLLGETL
jgi:hypothetical protein